MSTICCCVISSLQRCQLSTRTPFPRLQPGSEAMHLIEVTGQGDGMRKIASIVGLMLLAVAAVTAAPNPSRSAQDRPFPAILKNARYVYVAAYDGDQFSPNLFSEDRAAIAAVEDSIRKWGKLTVVYHPSDADIIVLVQSRPSEDVLAVYDAHF